MYKIKLFSLSIDQIVIRFYLMMLVAFVLGFAQQWILMAFLAGPIGASAILGISFEPETKKRKTTGKIIETNWDKEIRKAG